MVSDVNKRNTRMFKLTAVSSNSWVKNVSVIASRDRKNSKSSRSGRKVIRHFNAM